MGVSQVYMSCYIEIGKYIFRNVNSVRIESSWKELTSRATIKLPNIKRLLEKDIKNGDEVLIRLGYNGELKDEFVGYVASVSPKIPLEIMCEDEMWKLKQKTVSHSWRSVKLKDVLKTLVPDATIECPDVTLSPFRLDKVTVAMALEKLKDEYMLVVYFRNKKLFVGLAYNEKSLGEVNYHFQKNAMMSSLVFKKKEDIKIKVKAISIMPDNTRIEYEAGDPDGGQHTVHFYNHTKAELQALVKEKINRMKFDGYRGSFKAFGIPLPQHGMVANMMDDRYPERAGSFFIDGVTTDYGADGFRREVELGRSANSTLIE